MGFWGLGFRVQDWGHTALALLTCTLVVIGGFAGLANPHVLRKYSLQACQLAYISPAISELQFIETLCRFSIATHCTVERAST